MENKIIELINSNNSIIILTHESPDGDAVGSSMAMYHYLVSINKSVDVMILNIPKVFSYLDDINKVVDTSNKSYDLAIILDCASLKRVGQLTTVLINCKQSICIDHHDTNTKYADYNYIDGKSPACSQILFYLFKKWNVSFNNTIGNDLITGLITDTNCFRNDNVNSDTFTMASELLNIGVNIHNIIDKVYFIKSKPQILLMKLVMDRLEILMDGKVAFSYITNEDMINSNASYGDHEGLVEIGRSVDGVEISVFLREENGYKVSIRTNKIINASKIAQAFEGGGHERAAGCTINSSFEETKKLILDEIKKVINE